MLMFILVFGLMFIAILMVMGVHVLVMMMFGEYKHIGAIHDNRISGNSQLVAPLLHWQSQVQPLPWPKPPLLEPAATGLSSARDLVEDFHIEPHGLRLFIDVVIHSQQFRANFMGAVFVVFMVLIVFRLAV